MTTQDSRAIVQTWRPALGLLIALALPFIPLGRWIAPGPSVPALLWREVVWWVYGAIIITWLLAVERQPLASIGFRRPTWRTFAAAVAAAIAVTAILAAEFTLIIPLFHLDAARAIGAMTDIMNTPYWCRVLTVLRAAIIEELLFRAYLMEKIRQLSGSWTAAIAVSAFTFAAAHLSGWGAVHLIPVFLAAIVFSLLYRWRRDTVSNMIAHFMTDAVGFLLG